jgi:WXXGXW repeat (2 copies)
MKRALAAAAIVLATGGLAGCGAGSILPGPKTGPHVGEEPMIVPYPPPPPHVEVVKDRSKEQVTWVWIDGEWQWKGRRWVWQAGRWQEPLPGGYYAPPITVRLGDGTLAYYAGTWKAAGKK